MSGIGVRAPGKVVLLGEYAVLDGAPAIVAAVDSGVEARFTRGPTHEIVAPDTRFVGPALAEAPSGTYTFSAWNPVATPSKPGLGSSAAATVAAVMTATLATGSSVAPEHVFARAASVHRRVQGSGSGIDIAASVYGGVLRFRDGEVASEPIDLGDRLAVAWVGASAETGPRIAVFRAATDRASFAARSAAIVASWRQDPISAFAEAAAALGELDRRLGLGWWIDAYGPLLALARDHGGAAKPSGAGGGDVVVAVFPDRDRRDAWLAAAPGAGGVPLHLNISIGACAIG